MTVRWQLVGDGPWGVEDVAYVTEIPTRTLQRWHDEGWAPADHEQGKRGVLRYRRDNLARIGAICALREKGIGMKRAVELAAAIERKQGEFLAAVKPSALCTP